jgi:hypothetical protein
MPGLNWTRPVWLPGDRAPNELIEPRKATLKPINGPHILAEWHEPELGQNCLTIRSGCGDTLPTIRAKPD